MKKEPVAIYARYSTDRQDARSIDDQERRCRDHAQRAGYDVVLVYSDAATSGAHTDRVGIQKLLRDAKRQPSPFRAVLVDDLSRLSRDLGNTFRIIFEELAAENVRVIDVTTGIASNSQNARLTFGALALVNDQFLQLVRTETHRGLEGRALSGFWTGGKVYGYKTIAEENAPDPEHTRKRPVIHDEEAVVVRRVFTLFSDGMSLKRIASTLNEEHIPAPHDGGKGHKIGRGWGHTTIRAMLKNERYLGKWTWNASKWVRVPGKKSRRRIARSDDEKITNHYPELAIISKASWQMVEARFARRKPGKGRPAGTGLHPYLMTGLLKCGVCGGSIAVTTAIRSGGERYAMFGCTTHRSRGSAICDNNLNVSERKIRRALLNAVQDTLSDPVVIARFRLAFEQRLAGQLAKSPDGAKELDRMIAEAERRLKNVTEAFARASWSQALAEQLKEEEERVAGLKAKRVSRGDRREHMPSGEEIAAYAMNISTVLEADTVRGREILARNLGPVIMTPEESEHGRVYRMAGAMNVVGVLNEKTSVPEGTEVCDKSSSGGGI